MTDKISAPASADTGAILHAIGELRGEMRVAHQTNSQRFEALRADIARLEAGVNDRITRVEQAFTQQLRDQTDQLGKRLDGLGTRVTSLEAEDKRLIEKVAKVSALGGSVSGGIIAGAIELLKHIGK